MTKFGARRCHPLFLFVGREYDRGEESGRKARPTCVMIIFRGQEGKQTTLLFPITSRRPDPLADAVEIPEIETRRAKLTRPPGSSWMNSTATIWKHLSPLRMPNVLERSVENLWHALRPQPLLPSAKDRSGPFPGADAFLILLLCANIGLNGQYPDTPQ